MANKVKEEKVNLDFEIDTTPNEEMTEVIVNERREIPVKEKKTDSKETKPLINCLRNEVVIVRYILKQKGRITDSRHVLYGGMANNAVRKFTVPQLSSGTYVNVLTNNEKAFLEHYMGLEDNALSIHKKVDNFWDDTNDNGISQVILKKLDNVFKLNDPIDYIKYKILLANKDLICPSYRELLDYPKNTYQFVIVNEGDIEKNELLNMTNIQKCYKEFGKIETDRDKLRVVLECLTGNATSSDSKLEWLQTNLNSYIQKDPKAVLQVFNDPYLDIKVIIKKAKDAGIISYRGNLLYLRADNTPLCDYNEEPTLTNAAKYLSNPIHLDVLFAIEAKLK